MLLAACVLLCTDSTSSYSGRDHQSTCRFRAWKPRWSWTVTSPTPSGPGRAVDRFSQYSPNDDVPAADSTQVLVWYSATAIYFGIRAFEQHGRPTVTLASRDQIFDDDNVQILLGTFHDGKQP